MGVASLPQAPTAQCALRNSRISESTGGGRDTIRASRQAFVPPGLQHRARRSCGVRRLFMMFRLDHTVAMPQPPIDCAAPPRIDYCRCLRIGNAFKAMSVPIAAAGDERCITAICDDGLARSTRNWRSHTLCTAFICDSYTAPPSDDRHKWS